MNTLTNRGQIAINTANLQPDWWQKNGSYVIDATHASYYIVNTQLIYDANPAEDTVPKWLQEQLGYINFNLSAQFLLDSHRYTDPITPHNPFVITIGDFMNTLKSQGIDMATYSYETYVSIQFNSGAYTYTKVPYKTTESCYSIPFLNTLKNEFGTAASFKFVAVQDATHTNLFHTHILVLAASGLELAHFNYSENPGTGNG